MTILFLILLSGQIQVSTPAPRPLPKYVQSLCSSDYIAWATWQNEQMKARIKQEEMFNRESPYITGIQTSRYISTLNVGSGKRSKRNNTAGWNVGWINMSSQTVPQTYVNTRYVPAGPLTIYNPYAKPTNRTGNPDWAHLFVPCKKGTLTLLEAMSACRGPVDPELLYQKLFEKWLAGDPQPIDKAPEHAIIK
jgi:hypothetical protein